MKKRKSKQDDWDINKIKDQQESAETFSSCEQWGRKVAKEIYEAHRNIFNHMHCEGLWSPEIMQGIIAQGFFKGLLAKEDLIDKFIIP